LVSAFIVGLLIFFRSYGNKIKANNAETKWEKGKQKTIIYFPYVLAWPTKGK
tara:strand:- start:94 stop:249 length:156 start_codon:yes stop_codon:yes gene_type:complete